MEESEEERDERIGNELSKRFAAERVTVALSHKKRLENSKKTARPKKKAQPKKKATSKKRTKPSKRYIESEALRKAIERHAAEQQEKKRAEEALAEAQIAVHSLRLLSEGSSYTEARAINERLSKCLEDEPEYEFPIELFDIKGIYKETGVWLGGLSFLKRRNHV